MKSVVRCIVLTGLFVLTCALSASAAEVTELKRDKGPNPDSEGGRVDHVLCVDGLKVFQTVAYGYGTGSGAAVSTIQMYEEKDGKLVPARCSNR